MRLYGLEGEMKGQNKPEPKASAEENDFIIPPPETVNVEAIPRVVLYKADGTALKRQIGYKT